MQITNSVNFLLKILRRVPIFIASLAMILLVYNLGFEQNENEIRYIHSFYILTISIGLISAVFQYFFKATRPKVRAVFVDILFFLYITNIVLVKFGIISPETTFTAIMMRNIFTYIAVIIVFIREIMNFTIDIRTTIVSAGQIFILSFLFIIILGTFLLLLPNATNSKISFIDALFTSTSAVCVTGLTIADTATYFTLLGQIIIIFLIQVGGLGIMTFASYFSYFFKGGTSFNNQLMLQDMTNTETMEDVFLMLRRIILLTFLIELVGAIFVFHAINDIETLDVSDKVFYSVFHAVSGFCNAGFSTFENGLCNPIIKFNYPLQVIIAFLIIFGGLGFPILYNVYRVVVNKIQNNIRKYILKKPKIIIPRLVSINTKIVIITTIILLIGGTVGYMFFEYDNTLQEHNFIGKIVVSFFSSTTSRTAGFNSVDFGQTGIQATLLIIFLMWIGASPASTGGGIKTSSFAISILNIIRLLKRKETLEFSNREISENSINRAYAIIVLSIFVIGTACFLLSITDSNLGLLNILFETVSAFSTVGLSRNVSPLLSEYGKIIIIITMFIGRVNMLTILSAIFGKISRDNYKYPNEKILIN